MTPLSRSLVVGNDGSAGAERALEFALDLAERLSTSVVIGRSWSDGTRLSAVEQLLGRSTAEAEAQAAATVTAALVEDCGSAARKHPSLTIDYVVREGSPARVLCELSRHQRMLVVGSRGLGGFAGLALGSVSNQCLHESRTPVLVIPHDAPTSEREHADDRSSPEISELSKLPRPAAGSIVVGHDGSPRSHHALSEAIALAEQLAVPVVVVRAWSIDTAPRGSIWKEGFVASYAEIAEEVLGGLRSQTASLVLAHPGVTFEHYAILGYPSDVLRDVSKGAAFLVVGSRGLGDVAGLLLGSVSTQCVHRATCPVLVVPSLS